MLMRTNKIKYIFTNRGMWEMGFNHSSNVLSDLNQEQHQPINKIKLFADPFEYASRSIEQQNIEGKKLS